MAHGLEIERKFVAELLDDPAAVEGARVLRLEQRYLIDDGTGTRRVRRTGENGTVRFHYTAKVAIAPGVRREDEREITEDEWREHLADADPDRLPISKIRYALPGADGRTWEIDVFAGPLTGLVLAEVELESEDALADVPAPPACVRLVSDATDDDRYANAALARLTAPPRA